MLINLKKCRFFIRPRIADLRKAINGLTVLVQNEMKNNLFSKSLFLFCNRQRKILKIVYWDKNGLFLWLIRCFAFYSPLQTGTETPGVTEVAMSFYEGAATEVSFDELSMLLSWIDFFKSDKELTYSRV